MKKIWFVILAAAFFLPLPAAMAADTVSVVTKEAVKEWMDTGPVTILDVRQGRDWTASEVKILTAQRVDPGNFSAWKDTYPKDTRLVLYCA
jgi:rhodanese-related sulfurtransferase